MVFGPCGGVREDAQCEAQDARCGFIDAPTPLWSPSALAAGHPDGLRDLRADTGGQHAGAIRFAERLRSEWVVTADLMLRATDSSVVADTSARLASVLSAAVLGELATAGPTLAPAHRAALIQASGLNVISALTCRDRNRVALEGELAALADVQVAAVLALTGDYPTRRDKDTSAAVFDLDSTRLAALAHRGGHLVAVAEQPAAHPVARRAERLRQKLNAGAEMCLVNMCGGADAVARFREDLEMIGAEIPLIPVIPVVLSAAAADGLSTLPGTVVEPSLREQLSRASQPEQVGIKYAVSLAHELAAISGVAGVHLSVFGMSDDPTGVRASLLLADIAHRIRMEGR
ncbi:5,10-methylenetetrahydrofolate reductase [Microbacterium halimionae]|uniref:Methylenetetrahydrofolate reductase n=1 Tax=Microbacterium halimionae TaxID=1526413 RepID=A0A7W3JRA4_9MICO|nr:methylenetetrahydrofolate reductase [Microbacterium halimionae]MBA8817493.1 5,10-methylenetetrahydrofolate reductase [Microbacterium halimionae]NII95064.1 5,10-methylenetetrahydrofolate reductase [Microbacterium halimionae]